MFGSLLGDPGEGPRPAQGPIWGLAGCDFVSSNSFLPFEREKNVVRLCISFDHLIIFWRGTRLRAFGMRKQWESKDSGIYFIRSDSFYRSNGKMGSNI